MLRSHNVGDFSRMRLAGGKLKYLEKNLGQCHVNDHKYFIDWSTIEPLISAVVGRHVLLLKTVLIMTVILKILLNC